MNYTPNIHLTLSSTHGPRIKAHRGGGEFVLSNRRGKLNILAISYLCIFTSKVPGFSPATTTSVLYIEGHGTTILKLDIGECITYH